jgi:hypothetical protein
MALRTLAAIGRWSAANAILAVTMAPMIEFSWSISLPELFRLPRIDFGESLGLVGIVAVGRLAVLGAKVDMKLHY